MGVIAWVLIVAGVILVIIEFFGTINGISNDDGTLTLCCILSLISSIIMVACGAYIINNCECAAPRECSCGYVYTYEDEISYCPDCGAKVEGYPRTNEDK